MDSTMYEDSGGLLKRALFVSRALIKGLLIVFAAVMIGLHSLVVAYKWVNPPFTNMMLIHWWQSGMQMSLRCLHDTWVSLDQISPHMVAATLVSEDSHFFEHKGFYLKKMLYVLKQDLRKQKPAGSSTITQQVVKNVFLYPQKSYFRKLIEIYFTCLLEFIWGKDRILEVYLNIIELGRGFYGVERGAQYYFSKPASKICFDEACLLAAIISNPRYLDPLKPNNFIFYKASFIFRKGLAAAKKQKTDFPCLSGLRGLH